MTGPVLCAVDVSNGDDDLGTIRIAARLAALDDLQLDVIAVVPDFGMSVVGSFFDESHHETLIAETKTGLDALVTRALDAERNSAVRHVVATGRAYDEVLKLAEKSGASLIVVGASKADLSDYLLGPNAARIVRHSNCSVYVVR